jgi:predicted nucleic acid-binding protein
MSGKICLDTNVVINIFRNTPHVQMFLARYSRCLLPYRLAKNIPQNFV